MRPSRTSLLLGSVNLLAIVLYACGSSAPDAWFCQIDAKAYLSAIDGAQSLADAKKYAHQLRFFYCAFSGNGKTVDKNLDEVAKEKHISEPLKDIQKIRNYVNDLETQIREQQDKLNHCK